MINKIIEFASNNNCSDIHLSVGLPPVYRKNGRLVKGDNALSKEDISLIVVDMTTEHQRDQLLNLLEVDFAYVAGSVRLRVNIYRENGTPAVAIRLLRESIPSLAELSLPSSLERLANLTGGLVLVTGPTGSGKSTTLAAMIDYINTNKSQHIITLEDPVEYLHHHKSSIIHQREIGRDLLSFSSGLRSALREDPDVILVGEMRDLETISAAITAAETGHLVFSTLHTMGAAATIDRIVDVFPPHAQSQIRSQLSIVLKGVISQQLIPTADGNSRTAAVEILLSSDSTANLIRENKTHQLNTVMETRVQDGMCTLEYSLANLINKGVISLADGMNTTNKKEQLSAMIGI